MDKLKDLIAGCKGSVTIEVNNHTNYYETAAKYLEGVRSYQSNPLFEEMCQLMIEKDSVISIQFYPLTTIGFYKVWHWDLEQAISEAYFLFKSLGN